MLRQRRNSRAACWGALLIAVILFHQPIALQAAQGDCAQPVSTGSQNTASDCLFILRAAVGSIVCSPACICAPKGSLPATATDALLCLKKAVGQPVALNCPCTVSQQGDDFNDNSRDTAKWSLDEIDGFGMLRETGQVLMYTCSRGSSYDESIRPWHASKLPFNADWEVQVDLANTSILSQNNHTNSFGISVVDEKSNFANEIYGELYRSRSGGPPTRSGFYAELWKNDSYVASADTGSLAVTTAAVRLAFRAANKVVTVYYDIDNSNGYNWVVYGSFGLAGAGGATGNANWGLSNSDRLLVAVYGYSSNMAVPSGKIYGDNFLVTGGVAP